MFVEFSLPLAWRAFPSFCQMALWGKATKVWSYDARDPTATGPKMPCAKHLLFKRGGDRINVQKSGNNSAGSGGCPRAPIESPGRVAIWGGASFRLQLYMGILRGRGGNPLGQLSYFPIFEHLFCHRPVTHLGVLRVDFACSVVYQDALRTCE